jgi:hypothetical protein
MEERHYRVYLMSFAATGSGANRAQYLADVIYNGQGDSRMMAVIACGTSDAQRSEPPMSFAELRDRVEALLRAGAP